MNGATEDQIVKLKTQLDDREKRYNEMENSTYKFICLTCNQYFEAETICPNNSDHGIVLNVSFAKEKYKDEEITPLVRKLSHLEGKLVADNKLDVITSQFESEKATYEISEIEMLLSSPKTRKEGIFRLAEHCIYNHFSAFAFEDTEEIYVYINGVYAPYGDKLISGYVQKQLKLGSLVSANTISELFGYIRRLTYKKRSEIIEPIDKVCIKNGILNLNNGELEPHTPNLIFTNCLPVKYEKERDCPAIRAFLSQVVNETDLNIIQEIFGYCLWKNYPIQKAIMFVGGGSNGKSTLINILKTFLGENNCSAESLQRLMYNRFAAASLYGKLANLYADLSDDAIRDTSAFKTLTGGDYVPGERKFEHAFYFRNYAKLIFSCNRIPKSPDDSDAFFRRWIIVNFPNQFLGTNADKNLEAKLTTESELSGLLNFSITGLVRLLKNGDFSNSKNIDCVREDYIRRSDSVAAFVMDLIRISSEGYIPKKQIYMKYCDYCRNKNYPIVAENTFHKELITHIRVEDHRPTIAGVRTQCWRGIIISNNPDSPDSPDTKSSPNVNPVNPVKAFSNLSEYSQEAQDSDGEVVA